MRYVLIAAACLISAANFSQEQALINAASLFSGSYMRTTPHSFKATNLMVSNVLNYTPEALFDQSSKVWCAAEKAKFPHVFEVEFTERFTIERLEFDTRCEDFAGIGAKEVKVEFASSTVDPQYKEVGTFTLKENQLNSVDIANQEARMARISILSNHGHKQYTELTEFAAWGKPVSPEINVIDIDGTWRSNWGDATFKQNGALVSGDYVYHDGVIQYGGINRNQVTYTWIEEEYGLAGQTLMFLNEDGTRLTGIWCHGYDWTKYGFWILDRPKGKPFDVAQIAAEEATTKPEVDKSVVEQMKAELQEKDKIILYGINFKYNSSDILPSSYSTLNHVGDLLISSEDLQIRVEGHTDNVGSDEYNKKLSMERAQSVANYLEDNFKIPAERLTVKGMGESAPVADNSTEAGKAANRRVEIHNSRK